MDDLALKQDIGTYKFKRSLAFDVFKALNIQFHSISLIQRCPSIQELYGGMFFAVFSKDHSTAPRSSSLVEPRETFETEPSTFRVMYIPKNSQAAMPLSSNTNEPVLPHGCLTPSAHWDNEIQ